MRDLLILNLTNNSVNRKNPERIWQFLKCSAIISSKVPATDKTSLCNTSVVHQQLFIGDTYEEVAFYYYYIPDCDITLGISGEMGNWSYGGSKYHVPFSYWGLNI